MWDTVTCRINPSRLSLLIACTALLPLLAACSKNPPQAESQVLVSVNDKDISVRQLNAFMAWRPSTSTDRNAVRQQALDRLIDQELLVQKAIALKLDRDPGVEQAIDLSRRQILASAAMHALLASAASPPSRAMVHWFYLEHPQWFALRRRFDCIAFVVSRAALSDGLIHKLDSLHSADQTEGMLTRARIAHKTQPLQIQLERLPLSMQSTLLKMQPGDLMMVPNGASTTMLQLVRSENTPLSEVAARPAIEAFLGRAKHDADLSNTLRTLKQAARIHYVRRFIDNESSSVKSGQFLQIEARNM